jgi:hypothetical protein
MPCDALVCKREADCRDLDCPGHPKGAAAYLDELDRQSRVHHAAMTRRIEPGSFWPRDSAEQTKPRSLAKWIFAASAWLSFLCLCLALAIAAGVFT